MKTLITAGATVGLLIAAIPAHAQGRWGLEIRADGAIPTQDIGAGELGTGFGFEGAVTYRFLPHLRV